MNFINPNKVCARFGLTDTKPRLNTLLEYNVIRHAPLSVVMDAGWVFTHS